eukprot:CAMPEP_0173196822 /NCGR_PEP_ID=MMETSP1141-20130122/15827_1 /TAXON_ID=483371 /ORGANISM="non described non described, Strain CCMP2298" /LENGTH=333 /DNA_ID=CAMNT_0014121511 /DNA_START=141 /DNA_END=1139 /DNA_ORIENTATION=-
MTALKEITSKLIELEVDDAARNYASTIFTLVKSIEDDPPSVEEFSSFLTQTHAVLITGDSSKRSSILRTIRYCISTEAFVQALLDSQMHWAVVLSMERDGDCAVERMQALKVIERVMAASPGLFPITFARSLVAVANWREDPFRKVCIEVLNNLSLASPKLVAAVDGFIPLMEAVVEPVSRALADSILLNFIYLLNDPSTRAVVGNFIDLRNLLVPFTDLDSPTAELAPKWRACRSALVLLMRSWVGLVQLAADDMAWSTLVRMLKDPKVPPASQEAILDVIFDIFQPVMLKQRQVTRPQQSSSAEQTKRRPNGPHSQSPHTHSPQTNHPLGH